MKDIKPFIKWAGGKYKVSNDLIKFLPKNIKFNNYYEPFLGGGGMFCKLHNLSNTNNNFIFNKYYLSDINFDLICTWNEVKKNVNSLIKKLNFMKNNHTKEFYYNIRSKNYINNLDIASRFIYLNKTCFNGLYRENKKGKFNVPIGRYKNPNICDEQNLLNISTVLSKCDITNITYNNIRTSNNIKDNDLLYFDPPYYPISKTSNFLNYNKNGFNEDEQKALKNYVTNLHNNKKIYIMISNSDCEYIRKLYNNFNIHVIQTNRVINSKGNKRNKINEIVITNF